MVCNRLIGCFRQYCLRRAERIRVWVGFRSQPAPAVRAMRFTNFLGLGVFTRGRRTSRAANYPSNHDSKPDAVSATPDSPSEFLEPAKFPKYS